MAFNPLDNPLDAPVKPVASAPATTPFDATVPGQIMNFYKALPGSTLEVGKQLIQGLFRIPADLGISAAQAGVAIADRTFGTNYIEKATQPIPTDGLSVLLGTEPLKGYATKIEELSQSIAQSSFAKKTGLDRQAMPLAFAGVIGIEALNFIGGENTAIAKIAKERVPAVIEKMLIEWGIDQTIARKVAPHLADTTDHVEIKATLDTAHGMQALLNNAPKTEGQANLFEAPSQNKIAAQADEVAPTLETIRTEPGLFQQTRSLENLDRGGYEPYKVNEILKGFDEKRLLDSPIEIGQFDNGLVVTSGHNRLEVLRRAKAQGLLTQPDNAYMNITDYRGQGGIKAAVQESIASNVASKSVKDINLLDLYIRGSIDEPMLKNALAYDEKKIKYFNEVANSFKTNDLVDFWKASVGPRLADLKSLDFGVMQERLNFVNRIAKQTTAATRDLSTEQAKAVRNQVGKLIGEFLTTSKKATLASVERGVAQKLDVIKSGGFKNTELTNLFGEIVTQTEVAKKVPVQALEAAINDELKSTFVPPETASRLREIQKSIGTRTGWLVEYVNREGGLTKTATKTRALIQKLGTLSHDELIREVATPKMKANAAGLEKEFAAQQAGWAKDIGQIGKEIGLDVRVGPAKAEKRILEKLVTEYDGVIGQIRDGNRAAILVKTPEDVKPVLDAIIKKYGVPERAIHSNFDAPPGEYPRYRINVKLPSGLTAEIQITTPEMWTAKITNGGDALYHIVRTGVGDVSAARAEMQKLYVDALDASISRIRASDSALASDSDILWPSPKALNGEYGAPVDITIPKASLPSESTLTGVPSTSKNIGKSEDSLIPSKSTIEADKVQIAQRGVSVGRGTQQTVEQRAAQEAAIVEAGQKKIVDNVPLPPSIGDIIMQNGRAVPIERTPADAVAQLTQGPDAGSWQALTKGYMYNYSPENKAHLLDYLATPEFVLEKVGMGRGAELLQDAKDAYLNTLKKEFATIESWRERAGGPNASRLIFQYLDGKEKVVVSEMTDAELAVAQEIRVYLKEWADRLKLPEDRQISKYITHIFERDFLGKPNETFVDPELAAIMNTNVAKSVYDSFLQIRMGKQGYIEDVWRALDAYVKRGSRKEAMDPALENISEMAKSLDDRTYNYVMKLSHRVNMRPTELESSMDSLITQTPIGHYFTDRPTAFLSRKIRQIFYRGTLGLNFSSALRNLSQGANTYAKLGEKYSVIGYSKLFAKMTSRNLDELFAQNILSDAMVQDRNIGVIRKGMQNVDKGLFSLFDTAEKINRGAAYFGAKAQAINKGLSEEQAIKYAKRMVRETQFAFSAVDTPVALNDDVIKTLTQLQTYNIKQIEFLGRMMKQKDFVGLLRYSAATLTFLYTIGKVFGMTAQQIIPTVGLGGAPFTSTVLNIPGLWSDDPQKRAKAQSQLKRNLMTLIPAGAQIRKTIQGAEALAKGKSTSPTGRFRFRVGPEDAAQALIFGPSSLPQAQKYYDSIGKKKKTVGNPLD